MVKIMMISTKWDLFSQVGSSSLCICTVSCSDFVLNVFNFPDMMHFYMLCGVTYNTGLIQVRFSHLIESRHFKYIFRDGVRFGTREMVFHFQGVRYFKSNLGLRIGKISSIFRENFSASP